MGIPEALLQAIRNHRCAVFCGPGLGVEAGLPEPGDTKLVLTSMIQDALPGYDSSAKSLDEVASEFEELHGRGPLLEIIAESFVDGSPTETHRLIAGHFRFIMTGGFDNLFEMSLESQRIRYRKIYSEKTVDDFDPDRTNLIKLHGSFEEPESLLITANDIANYESNHPKMLSLLAHLLVEYPTVFLGFSIRDEAVRHLYVDIDPMMAASHQCYYEIDPEPDELKQMLSSSRGVEILPMTMHEFLREVNSQVATVK